MSFEQAVLAFNYAKYQPGLVFTIHSQEHFFLQDFVNLYVIIAHQKLCYIQMLLNIEDSREQDLERSKEWLVNTDSGI